jgi:hypothetical protein
MEAALPRSPSVHRCACQQSSEIAFPELHVCFGCKAENHARIGFSVCPLTDLEARDLLDLGQGRCGLVSQDSKPNRRL